MKPKEQFVPAATRHMDTIYRIAMSYLRDYHNANDITQDVLLALYETDQEFDSDEHLKNWLIRVTINKCKSHLRSFWRKSEDIEKYAETLGFEESSDHDLFVAVMKLDSKYRVPLMLHYYDGYKTAEIAELLGIPENTVSTRLRRAKSKLRDYLED